MKRPKTEERRARQEAAGIPDSRPFVAPEAFAIENSLPDGLKHEDLTVAGVPLTSLPEAAQGRILFQQTDQGVEWWERNRRTLENRDTLPPMERGMRMATGGIATDPAEKEMLQFRDDQVAGVTFQQALSRQGIKHTGRLVRADADPFALVMEKHVPAGYSGLMMSEKQCVTKGMVRGVVEYVPFLDAAGNRVTRGDMFLAIAPAEVVAEAKRGYEAADREQRQRATDRVREEQERIITDTKLNRIAGKNRARGDFEGLVDDDGPEMLTDPGVVFAG